MSRYIDAGDVSALVADFLLETVSVDSPKAGGGWKSEAVAVAAKHQPGGPVTVWNGPVPVTVDRTLWICDPATLPAGLVRGWRLTDQDGIHWQVIGDAGTTDEPLPRIQTQRQG